MRPTTGMHHIVASDFAIAGVAVGLQDAVKFCQELPRAVCTTVELEIKYDRCARSTILPQVGLMILALGSFGLDIDRSFIGLNVVAA